MESETKMVLYPSFDGGEKETMTATIYGFISSIYVSAQKSRQGRNEEHGYWVPEV